jgi:hypothetical protein
MRPPAHFAHQAEEHPALPRGNEERVSGYGVMGLPFSSGHILGLRRWTASSVGDRFTSIWHRDPIGHWTFYESADSEVGCTRYFGAEVSRVRVGPIDLEWETPDRLRVRTADAAVDWSIETRSRLLTRLVSALGITTPIAAWRSPTVLAAMGAIAGPALGAGKLQLAGQTPNAQHFEANPQRIWYVSASHARVEGEDLGRPGPLTQQAHLSDFYIPQRGIFAVGRVFITNPQPPCQDTTWPRRGEQPGSTFIPQKTPNGDSAKGR